MKWSFVKKLDNPDAVKEFSKGKGYNLPPHVHNMLEVRNAGYPSQDIFDTDVSLGREFKCLFSYNETDPESIHRYWPAIEHPVGLYPIGTDCGGVVYYDVSEGRYHLIDHETGRHETVIESTNPELFLLSAR